MAKFIKVEHTGGTSFVNAARVTSIGHWKRKDEETSVLRFVLGTNGAESRYIVSPEQLEAFNENGPTFVGTGDDPEINISDTVSKSEAERIARHQAFVAIKQKEDEERRTKSNEKLMQTALMYLRLREGK